MIWIRAEQERKHPPMLSRKSGQIPRTVCHRIARKATQLQKKMCQGLGLSAPNWQSMQTDRSEHKRRLNDRAKIQS
jgi:hypothetical protein